MRVGFLLGAGVSIPVGMPCTGELTRRVLDTTGYTLHPSRGFAKSIPGMRGANDWPVKQQDLGRFLNLVRDDCERYFDAEKKQNRQVNYEDIFFVASQLVEHLSQDYENPAMQPFAQSLDERLKGSRLHSSLEEVADLACNYIQDVVAIELKAVPVPVTLNHLNCLLDAVSDTGFSGCDIFTLNHDVLIESALESREISFVDGFGPPDGDFAPWSPRELEKNARTLLLKLHGSVNWRRYNGALKKTLTADPDHAVTANGTMAPIPAREIPVLLGTFNKIRDYFGQPYFDLFASLRTQLLSIGLLIVSGYSFGDKGVNSVLTEWMRSGEGRKMFILCAEGENCISHGRGAIRGLWNSYSNSGMYIHPAYLSDCNWDSLVEKYGLK